MEQPMNPCCCCALTVGIHCMAIAYIVFSFNVIMIYGFCLIFRDIVWADEYATISQAVGIVGIVICLFYLGLNVVLMISDSSRNITGLHVYLVLCIILDLAWIILQIVAFEYIPYPDSMIFKNSGFSQNTEYDYQSYDTRYRDNEESRSQLKQSPQKIVSLVVYLLVILFLTCYRSWVIVAFINEIKKEPGANGATAVPTQMHMNAQYGLGMPMYGPAVGTPSPMQMQMPPPSNPGQNLKFRNRPAPAPSKKMTVPKYIQFNSFLRMPKENLI